MSSTKGRYLENLITMQKSLIKILNRRGPRTNPSGSPGRSTNRDAIIQEISIQVGC
jgi:hypothetical protein